MMTLLFAMLLGLAFFYGFRLMGHLEHFFTTGRFFNKTSPDDR